MNSFSRKRWVQLLSNKFRYIFFYFEQIIVRYLNVQSENTKKGRPCGIMVHIDKYHKHIKSEKRSPIIENKM